MSFVIGNGNGRNVHIGAPPCARAPQARRNIFASLALSEHEQAEPEGPVRE